MKRLIVLLVSGWVAGCAAPVAGPAGPDRAGSEASASVRQVMAAAGPVCALGPDGGPPHTAPAVIADRGLGGTGGPAGRAGATRIAERGIGGTGIVGIVTGFASVCVNGLEVGYDNAAVVDINGVAASAAALRGGQLVLIEADGPVAAPHAHRISVRQEVAGRIETMELGSGTLTIAGSPVSVPAGTWGAEHFGLGDWVAVSGLPRPDGVIIASRLEAAPPDVFMARGQLVREGATAHVGRLVLPEAMANGFHDGQPVIVAGARGQVTSVAPDPMGTSPASYFGPAVDRLSLQGFVRVANGSVWIDGRRMGVSPASSRLSGPDGVAVVSLERAPDGSFTATGLRYTDVAVHAKPAAAALVKTGRRDAVIPPSTGHGGVASGQSASDAVKQDRTEGLTDGPDADTPSTPGGSTQASIDATPAPGSSPSLATTTIPMPTLAPTVSIANPPVAAPALPVNPMNLAPAAAAGAPLSAGVAPLPAGLAPLPASAAPLANSPTSDLISTNDKPAAVVPANPTVGPATNTVTIVQSPAPLPSRNVVVHTRHSGTKHNHEPPGAPAPPAATAPPAVTARPAATAPPALIAGTAGGNTTSLVTRTTIVVPQANPLAIAQRLPAIPPASRNLVVHARRGVR